MTGILATLQGKKTYICVGIAAIVFIAQLLGIVPANTAETIYGILGFGGILGLRSAIASSAPKQP